MRSCTRHHERRQHESARTTDRPRHQAWVDGWYAGCRRRSCRCRCQTAAADGQTADQRPRKRRPHRGTQSGRRACAGGGRTFAAPGKTCTPAPDSNSEGASIRRHDNAARTAVAEARRGWCVSSGNHTTDAHNTTSRVTRNNRCGTYMLVCGHANAREVHVVSKHAEGEEAGAAGVHSEQQGRKVAGQRLVLVTRPRQTAGEHTQ